MSILLFWVQPITQPSLWDYRESAHTGRHTQSPSHEPHRLPGSVRSSHSAKGDFSLQGRWGSFPFGLNSAVRDEALQNSSGLSRRINTPSLPASQPCWDLCSLLTAAPPPVDTVGIFSVTVAVLCMVFALARGEIKVERCSCSLNSCVFILYIYHCH